MTEVFGSQEISVPILTLKSGAFRYKVKSAKPESKLSSSSVSPVKINTLDGISLGENAGCCSLLYVRGKSNLYFKVPDQSLFRKTGEVKYATLECSNISAGDLKITTKFGSWNSMSCRLLIECYHPLTAWTTAEVYQPGSLEKSISHIGHPQESCMVKATFDLTHASVLRDILHDLKITKLKERKSMQEKHRKGIDKNIPVPSKIREGLPEWVNYVPAKWYSSTIRQVIEYMLFFYTMLTLMWALWQLYKHVDFIRQYLRPILRFVEYYLATLKAWFRWLDNFAEMLTNYWWTYMKPIYLLVAPLYLFLAQLFKPLRNVAGMVSVFLGPIIAGLKPVFQSMSGLFTALMHSFHVLWSNVLNSAAAQFLLIKSQELGLNRLLHELTHGGLDPLKAQVIVIRDLLIRSMRQIFYGLRFIFSRIHFAHLFLKREREYAQEQTNEQDNKEKAE